MALSLERYFVRRYKSLFAHAYALVPSLFRFADELIIQDRRDGRTYTIPIVNNTVQATEFMGIQKDPDTGKGLTVVDVGLRNTAVVTTATTNLDTASGTLSYRGRSIANVFSLCEYEEVAFLLIYGRLPSTPDVSSFTTAIVGAMDPPQQVMDVVRTFPTTAPSFTIIVAALATWNGTRPDGIPIHKGTNLYMSPDPRLVDEMNAQCMAALSSSVALTLCHKSGTLYRRPRLDRSMPFNILHMSGLVEASSDEPDPELVSILSKLMILYADHGMTNSTATFLCASSSLADPLSSIIASFASGYGPLHGGALEMAYKQFAAVGTPGNVPAFLVKAKSKEVRIFGFGHRIWKTTDPRERHLRQLLESPKLRERIRRDPLLSIAMEVDRLVRQDEYFVRRRIFPNMDLLGAFVFSALGFEHDMALGVAAVARSAGCLAHWREQLQEPVALWRPQSIYVPPEYQDDLQIEQKGNGLGFAPLRQRGKAL